MEYLDSRDKTFIDGYLNNIGNNYNVTETECELRAGQTIRQFGGIDNQITLPVFRKIKEYYSNLENTEDMQITSQTKESPSLDITFQKKTGNLNPSVTNLRFSLNGRTPITYYCANNKIPFNINEADGNVELIYKDNFKWESDTTDNQYFNDMKDKGYQPIQLPDKRLSANVDLTSIRTRLGGKVELKYDNKKREFVVSSIANQYLLNLKEQATETYRKLKVDSAYKFYRFKKRTSYKIMYKEVEFRIDLTAVKSSKMGFNNKPLAFRNFIDAEVAEQPESYEYEIEFNLKDKSSEILIDFINNIFIPSFIHSNIHPSYTLSLTQEKVLSQYKKIVIEMFKKRLSSKVEKIEKAIQFNTQSNDDEKDAINSQFKNKYNYFHLIKNKSLQELRKLSENYRLKIADADQMKGMFRQDSLYFISPKVVSIELNNIRNDNPTNSILENYTVTDKADGYSMILVKFSSNDTSDPELINKFFLIDSNLKVYDSGVKTKEGGTYLFNGEYLENDITKKERLNKYGIFDCYIYNNRDVCDLPLMSNNDIETRLSLANRYISQDYIESKTDESFGVFVKKFHMVSPQKNIFNCANNIWTDYQGRVINPDVGKEYYLDGLIFTPADHPVGYNPDNYDYDLKQNNTWSSNLKWKPPEDNTIDFLIKFEKDEILRQGERTITTNKIKRIPKISGGVTSYDQYIVANLYSGGYTDNSNPCFETHSKKHRVLKPVLFRPSQPNIPKISQILLPCNEDINTKKTNSHDEEGYIIDDDTIVEVSYTRFNENDDDYISNPNLRWKILRTRHDKTFNYRQGIYNQKKGFNLIQKALQLIQKSDGDLNQFDLRTIDNVIKMAINIPGFRTTPGKTNYQNLIQNKSKLEEFFRDYTDVRTNINFGNHQDVAKNIWRSIYNPVTTDMITSGNNIPSLSDEEQKYYNRDVKRDKSISISMQDFHNKVIKNRILMGTVSEDLKKKQDAITLLDMACGKGGDIPKWRDNNITTCVGVDYISNNIDDNRDGACSRYEFYKSQSQKQGKSIPKCYFLVGDVTKQMKDNKFITEQQYLTLANNLWNPNDQITTNFKQNRFDIVSVMFALHYFFRSESVLDQFIENVAYTVKPGGFFIGCCFDGKKIFEKLKEVSKGDSIDSFKNGRLMWKIIKNYREIQFMDNAESVGMSIKVYISSINQIIEEFLVNFEYLKKKLAKFNIVPLEGEELKELGLGNTNNESIGSFESVYKSQTNNPIIKKIISSLNLSPEEQDLSFMFNYFIFKRKTSGDEVLDNLVEIMLSDKFLPKLTKNKTKLLNDSTFAEFDKELVQKAIKKANVINLRRRKAEKAKKQEDLTTVSDTSTESTSGKTETSQEISTESSLPETSSQQDTTAESQEQKEPVEKAKPLKVKKAVTKKSKLVKKSKDDPKIEKLINKVITQATGAFSIFRDPGTPAEIKMNIKQKILNRIIDIQKKVPGDIRLIEIKKKIEDEQI